MGKKKGICAPHEWGIFQLRETFRRLSEKPFAKTIKKANKHMKESFWETVQAIPGDIELEGCPGIYDSDSFYDEKHRIHVACSTREFFLFGENGSIEFRKTDMMSIEDLQAAPDLKAELTKRYFCYGKAGADGNDVWGRSMFIPNYEPLTTPQ